ncbi:PhzF family phenazine biosynthesis protein [Variovorax sp. KBS0712]|uniref:PhzF family phenazine biosynthesis protein n=1 Tax=Variovorax sp. KBS0712 TaxID=2578111 RepID=UPI00111BB91F|nr:PhzF family phenazine biosynthesis protein [Variovorax sp. KBS0712]TSD61201.1 PhzF family phenazine biosynthesis protein [Variovorax sp. KBS0712]
MKRSHRYTVVDVFTSRPLAGNPVAVVFDADGLDTEAMQSIARWTNLSETTFVLPPTTPAADYRLRIFTPRSELPFAGHPALGSAHAVLEAGRATPREGGRLVQQCHIGLVDVAVEEGAEGRQLAFASPSAQIEPLPAADVAELERILGCALNREAAPAIVNVGPRWVILPLNDAATVRELQPDVARLAAFERRLAITGVTVFGRYPQGDVAIEVRTFAPSCGVEEDPVCGSGNASVAAFQWERGLLPAGGTAYVAAQGRCVGRDGRVKVQVDADGRVRVGGSCITCVEGVLAL